MATPPDYRVSHLQESQLPALQQLFKTMFGKRHSIEYLKSKYDVSYLGVQHCCFIAMIGEQAISFYGMIPMPARHGQASMLTAEACDYMTLPEYKSMGLHRELSGYSMQHATEQGVAFCFAMMSNDSLAAGKKLGWSFNPAMQRAYLPGGKLPIKRALYRSGLASMVKNNTRSAFADLIIEPDAFRNSLLESNFLHVDYTPGFLRYKQYNDNFHIETHGVKAWIKSDRSLHVGDLVFEREEQLAPAFSELQKRAARLGITEICVQCNADTPLGRYMGQHYTQLPSFQTAYFDLNGRADLALLRTNYGDFDTY